MRKLKIILIVVVSCVVVLGTGAFCVYKFYIKPDYIEPALETAQTIMKDKSFAQSLSGIVDEMHESGVITDDQFNQYKERYERNVMKTESGTVSAGSGSGSGAASGSGSTTVSGSGSAADTDNAEEKGVTQDGASNAVGAKKIKVKGGGETGNTSTHSTSAPEAGASDQTQDADVNALYEKAKSQISVEDQAIIYGIVSKIDIPHAKTLTSDKEQLKAYLKSVLSEDEYKTAIKMYVKYAYIFVS